MYRSPRDGQRAMSATQQTLMTQARADSTDRVDCCAAVGAGTSTSTADKPGHGAHKSVGLQLYTVTPGTVASSSKRQAPSPRNIEDSF